MGTGGREVIECVPVLCEDVGFEVVGTSGGVGTTVGVAGVGFLNGTSGATVGDEGDEEAFGFGISMVKERSTTVSAVPASFCFPTSKAVIGLPVLLPAEFVCCVVVVTAAFLLSRVEG